MSIARKIFVATGMSILAFATASCGGADEGAEAGNTTTTEMLSTETTLDGTTNDATSLDAAIGTDDEVTVPANEGAEDNASAE